MRGRLTQSKPKLGANPVIGGINLFQKASREIGGRQTMWKQTKQDEERECEAEKVVELPQKAEYARTHQSCRTRKNLMQP
jgi:hypothetical protein